MCSDLFLQSELLYLMSTVRTVFLFLHFVSPDEFSMCHQCLVLTVFLCVTFHLVSSIPYILLSSCLLAILVSASLFLVLSACASVCLSVSLHSVRQTALFLNQPFFLWFICSLSVASSLRCFSFSVSVFLQLSEFLSLCKSFCPFPFL